MALVNLPGYNPGNALSFAGINDAIDSNRQNALAQQQLGMQQRQLGMQEKRFDTEQQQVMAQRVGGMAQMGMSEKDPMRRQAILDRIISMHPDKTKLGPEYLSPDTAFPMLIQEAQGFRGIDDQAKTGLVQAQTEKARADAAKALREASDAGGAYGKDIKVFQGPDGKIYGVQAGSRGELKYHDLSAPGGGGGAPQVGPGGMAPQGAPARQPLTPFAKRTVVGDRIFNPATGQWEGSAAEALQGGEEAKGRGDAIVKLETSLPKARATLEAANAKVDIVRSKIAQALPMVSNWTTGYGSVLANWPATAARDFKGQVDTIVANLGFDELQEMRQNSPTGGALGQVAVQELDMLQKTKASLDQAQSPQQVMKALRELEDFYAGRQVIGPDGKVVKGPDGQVVRAGGAVERRQRAFDETYAPLARRTGNSPLVTGPSVPRQFNDRLPPTQQTSTGDLPRPSSPEEAARLPRGTRFMAPDGSVRVVP